MIWKISRAFLCGRIHKDQVTQDYGMHVITDDYAAVVLCDGASSSRFAAEASIKAAEAMMSVINVCKLKLFDMSDDELRELIVAQVRQVLRDGAAAKGTSTDDFLTTMSVLICTDKEYLALNIGDGLIAYIPDDEALGGETILAPVNGKYINTCYFITQSNAEEHIEIARGTFSQEGSYALMTDGAVTCLYNRRERTYAPMLKKFFCPWVKDHKFNVAQDAIKRVMINTFPQKTSDDCSLIILRGNS